MNIILNEKFGIPGLVNFTTGRGNLSIAEIKQKNAKAVVSLYGAHLLSFQPNGQPDVLWMSDLSAFEEGNPIRGGIPVCFPWFGPHISNPQKPLHGFARLHLWEVVGTSILSGDEIQIRLNMKDTPETKELWPFSFQAEMIITVGSSLEVTLVCTNTDNKTFTYSDALHTYFAVSDVANIKLHGLKGYSYYDGLDNNTVKEQAEELLIVKKEESRRYFNFTGDCIIEDVGFSRKIRVRKRESRITLVWNPWSETAKKIPDMQDDGYKTMICVEAVNANEDKIELRPGESHTLSTILSIE